MPEILAWCNTVQIRHNSPVGAMPQGIYPARALRSDVLECFASGGYTLDKVRFLGYWEYGTDAENVPPLLLSVNLFYKEGMANDMLHNWAQRLAEKAGVKFSGLHVIVKIHAGSYWGFGEVNKPGDIPDQRN